MSDDNSRKPGLTGRGEPPLSSSDGAAEPPGFNVEGKIVAGVHAERRVQVAVTEEALSERLAQLKLDLVEALAQPKAKLPPKPRLKALLDEWLEKVAPTRVAPEAEAVYVRHLEPLFHHDEDSLTALAVEDLLASLRRPPSELSASTTNKVRGAGRLALVLAQSAHRWGAANPFDLVRRHKEPQRKYELLTLPELARVQAQLRDDRRRLFRVMLHLGLRTGEAFALQKRDVDFVARVVHVRRSHDRDTTKTGTLRTVPLVPAVGGDLLEALDSTEGDEPTKLFFPSADGGLQRRDTKLTRAMRDAMGKAGVGVVSVTHKCRRKSCGEWLIDESASPSLEGRVCPRCNTKMWPVPRVREVRWYDLRHICATLHHQHGADPLCIALALGHSVRGTTQSIYTHPDNATMLRELSRWKLEC